jgi:hypothetical protein
VQVAAEPEQAGLRASIAVTGVARSVDAALDETGAGQLRLPASARELRVTVRTAEHTVMRTPAVQVE